MESSNVEILGKEVKVRDELNEKLKKFSMSRKNKKAKKKNTVLKYVKKKKVERPIDKIIASQNSEEVKVNKLGGHCVIKDYRSCRFLVSMGIGRFGGKGKLSELMSHNDNLVINKVTKTLWWYSAAELTIDKSDSGYINFDRSLTMAENIADIFKFYIFDIPGENEHSYSNFTKCLGLMGRKCRVFDRFCEYYCHMKDQALKEKYHNKLLIMSCIFLLPMKMRYVPVYKPEYKMDGELDLYEFLRYWVICIRKEKRVINRFITDEAYTLGLKFGILLEDFVDDTGEAEELFWVGNETLENWVTLHLYESMTRYET